MVVIQTKLEGAVFVPCVVTFFVEINVEWEMVNFIRFVLNLVLVNIQLLYSLALQIKLLVLIQKILQVLAQVLKL